MFATANSGSSWYLVTIIPTLVESDNVLMNAKDAGGEVETGCVNVERRASSSSTSSVLSASPQRLTVTPSTASVGPAGPPGSHITSAPGGRGFDLLALREAITLATASTLRFAPPPPPPPAASELLRYGPGLRGLAAPSSAAYHSRPPTWLYPPPTSRYDLAGHQLDVKSAGFASHHRHDGTLLFITMMSSLKTVSCLKTVLRQFFQCIGLGFGLETWCFDVALAGSIFIFSHTATKEAVP